MPYADALAALHLLNLRPVLVPQLGHEALVLTRYGLVLIDTAVAASGCRLQAVIDLAMSHAVNAASASDLAAR